MPDYIPPPPDLPPGSVVWAYLRDSGGPTQDRSVEQQRDVLVNYCQRHGLDLTLVFSDVHRSGTSDTARDQFNEMIDMSVHERTRPHGILIWSTARFARNTLDAQFHRSTLRKRGIVIHSLTDEIPGGKFQIAFEAIIDVANQEKAEQASREARRGLHSIVLKDGAVPGTPPRGFKREPVLTTSGEGVRRTLHRWVPDPALAPRVRQAFEMRADGRSLAEINKECWLFGSINSFATFWKNKLYIGILEYGDLVIENYCEPIVDRETWDAVQLISEKYAQHGHMSDERLHPRRQASAFLLSGLCRCGRCGSPMWGQTSHQRSGNKIEAYRCTQAHRRRDCELPRIPASAFEQIIIDKLAETFSQPELYISIYRETQARRSTWLDKREQERRQLENDLRGLRRQADNFAQAIGSMGFSETIGTQLAKNELEQRAIKLKLHSITLQIASQPALNEKSDAQLTAESLRLADIFKSKNKTEIRPVLHGLVMQIDVDRQGKELIGVITIGINPDDDPPPGDLPPTQPGPGRYNNPINPNPSTHAVHKSRASVGAPSFTYSIPFRSMLYNKKPRSK